MSKGPGTSDSRPHLLEALNKGDSVVTEDITPEDIRAGKLARTHFDGSVVPGGDSDIQETTLDEETLFHHALLYRTHTDEKPANSPKADTPVASATTAP